MAAFELAASAASLAAGGIAVAAFALAVSSRSLFRAIGAFAAGIVAFASLVALLGAPLVAALELVVGLGLTSVLFLVVAVIAADDARGPPGARIGPAPGPVPGARAPSWTATLAALAWPATLTDARARALFADRRLRAGLSLAALALGLAGAVAAAAPEASGAPAGWVGDALWETRGLDVAGQGLLLFASALGALAVVGKGEPT